MTNKKHPFSNGESGGPRKKKRGERVVWREMFSRSLLFEKKRKRVTSFLASVRFKPCAGHGYNDE